MSQAELPFTFVSIAVSPLVLTVTVCFVLNPLSNIAITSETLPDTVSVLDSVYPLTIVGISRHPRVKTFAIHLTLVILSKVLVAIAKPLVTFSMAFVIDPFTLVNSTDFINANALTMTMTFD